MTRALYVAVLGGDDPEGEAVEHAEEVGRLLGRAGAIVVCGGGAGVMEAACRGAQEEGALTVGILSGTTRDSANEHLTISIPTGMGEMRNVLVVRAADAVIAIAGEFGTLSEVAFALKTDVPVVGLKTWELAKTGGDAVDAFPTVQTPAEAVDEALRAARSSRHRAGGRS